MNCNSIIAKSFFHFFSPPFFFVSLTVPNICATGLKKIKFSHFFLYSFLIEKMRG